MFEHKLRAASILLLLGTGMGRGPRCRFQTEREGHRVHIPRPKGAGRAVCQNDGRRRSSLPILDLNAGEEENAPWIEGCHCVHDLKAGAFSVPADFAENNAKAVKYPEPK